jgi:hypothetical protein
MGCRRAGSCSKRRVACAAVSVALQVCDDTQLAGL